MKTRCGTLVLALAVWALLTSCSGRAQAQSTRGGGTAGAGAQTSSSGGNVLVAYFTHEGNNVFSGDETDVDAITSASVQRDGRRFPPQVVNGVHKGNTQIIADYVADITGGTLFAIQVADSAQYPLDGFETLDVAQRELSQDARPPLKTHVDNIADYDVIYLGYPIWWGTMPQAVFTFLEEYDFSGKTIIPFCTHDGSRLGRSVHDIEELCPGATVGEGLAVRYSDVRDARGRVAEWIEDAN